MSTGNEKRSSNKQMKHQHPNTKGVGGRQAHIDPLARGGGYLDICNETEFGRQADQKKSPRDPRLTELREMGLTPIWVSVAELIGYDQFIRMWMLMDTILNETHYTEGSSARIRLPRIDKYHRFQRNQVIRTLAGPPLSLSFIEIQKIVKSELGEIISHTTVRRVAKL